MAGYLQPAPKRLAMLAVEMRGWDYEEIYAALIGCHGAGWSDFKICKETFRLLLLEDASPKDLRVAARRPAPGDTGGTPKSPAVRAMLDRAVQRADEATEQQRAQALQAGRRDDPETAA